jgi:hypothetical protein
MSNEILSNISHNNGFDNDFPTQEHVVDKNSMPEDDPNGNTIHVAHQIRWGPQHAGAKLLASQYTRGRLMNQSDLSLQAS